MFKRFIHLVRQDTPAYNAVKIIMNKKEINFTTSKKQEENKDYITINYSTSEEAKENKLAYSLFQIDTVQNVFIKECFNSSENSFVTISLKDDMHWLNKIDIIEKTIISSYYASIFESLGMLSKSEAKSESKSSRILSEVESKAEEIIERYVRPPILEDGGNIVIDKFDEETKILYIKLEGSCKSCTNSYVTLKNNVENTILHFVEEIEEVRQSHTV